MSADFHSEGLVAVGGEIYAHIFENPSVGIKRGLFWSITMELRVMSRDRRQHPYSMNCEWIPWSIRRWRELDGQRLDVDFDKDGIEASFYMMEHMPATHVRLDVAHRRENSFRVDLEMVTRLDAVSHEGTGAQKQVSGVAVMPFTGVIVVPSNLSPSPASVDEVKQVAREFIDLNAYHDVEQGSFNYVFRPKW